MTSNSTIQKLDTTIIASAVKNKVNTSTSNYYLYLNYTCHIFMELINIMESYSDQISYMKHNINHFNLLD